MKITKILEKNDRKFVEDLKRVSECLVIPNASNAYLPVTKTRLAKEAESEKIVYYLTKKIYKVGREVMVIV